jgi:hypothetical protein
MPREDDGMQFTYPTHDAEHGDEDQTLAGGGIPVLR